MKTHPLIIVSGPTATGKTAMAIKLAKELSNDQRELVIINFDSLLFYKELSIGTAKPTIEERQGITHLGLDIVSIQDDFNASSFNQEAENLIIKLHGEGKIPILVGGSAFYLRALIKGMYESASPTIEVRSQVESLFQSGGIELVRAELLKVDPESVHKLHANDHYRNMRALEHFLTTGTKISQQDKEFKENDPYDFSKSKHPEWSLHHIYLDVPKEVHWEIIQKRTRQMIDQGLEAEVRALLANGFSRDLKALGSIGYKETLDYIDGKFENVAAWSERISLSTRQLAKSQRTFFKKVTPKNSYNPLHDTKQILSEAAAFLCKWP